MPHSVFFTLRQNRVHALCFGQGPELLIALHGFGDRARLFSVLEPVLAKRYTVYSLDLPFHGQTEWPEETFSKADFRAVFAQILQKEGKTRFSLMAYSFGARLAQALLPDFAGQVNRLFLLAPDGIHTKGMSAATRTPMWVRRLLKIFLKNPDWFLTLVRAGTRLKIVPALIGHFLQSNLSKPERFRRAFGCWLSMNDFYLGRRRIKKILRESNFPVEVFFGTKDEMIRFKTLKKMADGLPNMHLHLLDTGHRVVGEQLEKALIVLHEDLSS